MAFRFETENFVVREVLFSDYDFFLKWEQDQEMVKYFSIDMGRTYEDVVTEGFAFKTDDTVIDCAIADKNTDEPLGRIIISRIDKHYNSLDITKIYVGGNRRGQGIGSEVMVGLLKYLFEEKKLERVTLDHYTDNVRAGALYERLGFQREGVARHACIKNGEYFDLHIMSMLSADYFAKY